MERINKDIASGQFSPYYLLWGEEDYLKSQALSKLQKAILKDGSDMNYLYFEGKKFKEEEFLSFGQTLPFFADYRLVVLKDTNFFKESCESFMEALDAISPTTIVIFVESVCDKRNRLYKLVKEKGYVSEMNSLDEKSLLIWLKKRFLEEGKKISDRNIAYFLECIGKDMNLLKNEMEKLCCYVGEKDEITRQDMDEIMVPQVEGKVFEMLSAIGTKNRQRVMELYHDLLETKEPIMKLFVLLVRQVNLLVQTKSAGGAGLSKGEIAQKVGIPPFAVGKTLEQAKQFDSQTLHEILEECAEMEQNIKQGRIKDQMALEVLLVSFLNR